MSAGTACTLRGRGGAPASRAPHPAPSGSLAEEPADQEAGGAQWQASLEGQPVLSAGAASARAAPQPAVALRAACSDQQPVPPGCGLWFLFLFCLVLADVARLGPGGREVPMVGLNSPGTGHGGTGGRGVSDMPH